MTERMGVDPEDRALADAVARYAAEALAPRAQALDEEGLCATCHVPGLAELGVMGMNIPEQYGGPGVTPTAMLLSLAMMLDWLAVRHADAALADGARAIEAAVRRAFETGAVRPREFGGASNTADITRAVVQGLR